MKKRIREYRLGGKHESSFALPGLSVLLVRKMTEDLFCTGNQHESEQSSSLETCTAAFCFRFFKAIAPIRHAGMRTGAIRMNSHSIP